MDFSFIPMPIAIAYFSLFYLLLNAVFCGCDTKYEKSGVNNSIFYCEEIYQQQQNITKHAYMHLVLNLHVLN